MPSCSRRTQPQLMALGLATALVAALSGVAGAAEGAAVDDGASPRVVVAAVDTGVNAYHEFFNHGGEGPYADVAPSAVTQDVLDEFGIGEDQIIDLTRTGDPFADLEADDARWDAVEPGKPYWFRGTNVIGISFRTSDHLRPSPDKGTHGTGVSAAVLNANPGAVMVMVESPVSVPLAQGQAQTDAERWAFTHPAIDMVTTSYGPPGSPPLPAHLTSSYIGVVEHGKLHFGAVDNNPVLSPIDTTGGPWWSIGVAGYQEGGGEGRDMRSGQLPDFVGDFTQTLPYCNACQEGERSVSGTSFATPRSAGTMSAILLAAREAAGHAGGIVSDGLERPAMLLDGDEAVTNWDLRRVLEEAAYTLTPDDHDGGGATSVAVPEEAPWALIGWGAITPDPERGVIAEALAHLGVEGDPTRFKGDDTCAAMTVNIEARYAYWTYYAFAGESWLQEDFPYEPCM